MLSEERKKREKERERGREMERERKRERDLDPIKPTLGYFWKTWRVFCTSSEVENGCNEREKS